MRLALAKRQEQITKRRERAWQEKPIVARVSGDAFFGHYQVAGSRGQFYKVVAALDPRRQGLCTCHDFAMNGLGTCKHLEAVRFFLQDNGGGPTWRDPTEIARGDLSSLDVLVFDLETQRLFEEVGGRDHVSRLGVSLAVVKNLRDGSVCTYNEAQVADLAEHLATADLVVGFNVLNFDYPVLEGYGAVQVYKAPTFDIMLAVEDELGFKVGLDALASSTLGIGKSADGVAAVEWYRCGRLDLVEEYCKGDVDVTARLFQYGRDQGFVSFTGRDGTYRRVRALWHATEVEVAG